jgi:hypothetical protein
MPLIEYCLKRNLEGLLASWRSANNGVNVTMHIFSLEVCPVFKDKTMVGYMNLSLFPVFS